MRLQKEKWNFRSLDEVHQAANTVLRFAMFNERSKRWPKVAESYKRLLWLVDRTHFPKDYEPPGSYAILMYELHFHLGVALQRLDQHRKAVVHFTKAIQAVSIPKGGCLAGCVTNSCLMTPILARRAFGYAKVGDLRSCLRDAENCVVLDSQNPDVYCIRALARGTRDEESLAIQDVNQSLKISPSHVCALVIRGALYRTLAEKLNPESQTFYTLSDFRHPCMLDFYDRFLFTLSVPHTITDINLTPDKPSKKQLDSTPNPHSSCPSRASSAESHGDRSEARGSEAQWLRRDTTEPFRCGTPAPLDDKSAARRRKDYGDAVRRHTARPKTATQFMAQLEKARTRRMLMEQQSQRPVSSATRIQPPGPPQTSTALSPRDGGTPFTADGKSAVASRVMASSASSFLSPCRAVSDAAAPDRGGSSTSERGVSIQSEAGGPNLDRTKLSGICLEVETRTTSGRTTRTTCTKTFQYDTPTNYSLPVFQPMNIKDAPRMYYRPWRGDKLPVADVPHPVPSAAFY